MTDPIQPPVKPSSSGFEMNRPTIIALLYLASLVTVVTGVIGVVLAYVWRNEAHADWETSHYTYLIGTFWIALIGTCISFPLMLVLIGFPLLAAVGILTLVRSVLALVNAQKQTAMPNPGTLLA